MVFCLPISGVLNIENEILKTEADTGRGSCRCSKFEKLILFVLIYGTVMAPDLWVYRTVIYGFVSVIRRDGFGSGKTLQERAGLAIVLIIVKNNCRLS